MGRYEIVVPESACLRWFDPSEHFPFSGWTRQPLDVQAQVDEGAPYFTLGTVGDKYSSLIQSICHPLEGGCRPELGLRFWSERIIIDQMILALGIFGLQTVSDCL